MMIRPFTLFCAFFAGISGMVLYAQKHKTTQLDKQITKIVYDTQRIKSSTAMLRTEWTLLNQPDRLKALSTHFIPGLRPLNPAQFVQMSVVASVLPPIRQDQEQDKTREQLVKNVAQNHGQSPAVIADAVATQSSNHKEPPVIVAQNTETTISSLPQQKQVIPPAITPTANNDTINPVVPSRPARRKKVKNIEAANATTDTAETSNVKTQTVKKPIITATQNNNTEAVIPTGRKKAKNTEVANVIETPNLKPQAIKKNHIENVSYNIQSGNPFSHNKATRSKPISSGQDNDISNTLAAEKKPIKQAQQATTLPKKRPATIKVARYEAKKSNYSESALGSNTSDALPAPVPFAP